MTNINRMFLTSLSHRILSRSFIVAFAGLLLIVVALFQNGGHANAQARSKAFESGILAPQSDGWVNNQNASMVPTAVPTLTSVGPNSAPAGSPNTTVTLTGTGFINGSTADFNGTPIITTFVSATTLTAVIPAADVTTAAVDNITVVTAGPGGGTSGPQTFTITAPATVQFSTASETVNESAGTFSIAVTLTGNPSGTVTVPFTLGGTAISGTDYSGVTASPLTFGVGQTTQNITGTLIDDGLPDAVKTLTFNLGTPTNATLGSPAVNTLTIAEPVVQFSAASETVNETAGTFSIPVTLTGSPSGTVTVPFTLGGTAISGTDYSGITASPLTFGVGQTTQNITGTLIDDGLPDAVKTLTFNLGTPTNATLGSPAVNTLTIAEAVVTFSAASETVNETAGTFSIAVTLTGTPSITVTTFASGFNGLVGLAFDAAGNLYVANNSIGTVSKVSSTVTVPFTLGGTAISGTDYSGVTASPLTFGIGQTTQNITGTLIDDGPPDAVKTLTFNLGTPTNATLGSPAINTLTIAEPATAAGVSVSGRVSTADGRGLRNASVVLTDAKGVARTVTTGTFGYYQFDDVQSGETYLIGVMSKRYRFASRVISVNDQLNGVDFIGDE